MFFLDDKIVNDWTCESKEDVHKKHEREFEEGIGIIFNNGTGMYEERR